MDYSKQLDAVRKLKNDICRTVGHEIDDHRCGRCGYLEIACDLQERLSATFVGSKYTQQTANHIMIAATNILNSYTQAGDITAYRNVTASLNRNKFFDLKAEISLTLNGDWMPAWQFLQVTIL